MMRNPAPKTSKAMMQALVPFLRAFAAGFYGNDPAGTLLFWRGWSLHDRQTRLHDRLHIPDLPVWRSGAVVGTAPNSVAPFGETDDRPGAYAGIEWRYARRVLAQFARYDNRADPYSFEDTQWGWRTAFDHFAVQLLRTGQFQRALVGHAERRQDDNLAE